MQRKKRRSSRRQSVRQINKTTDFHKGYEKGLWEGRRRTLPQPLTHSSPRFYINDDVNLQGMSVHAFIAARNEADNIAEVIKSAQLAGADKVIVVANGCNDQTIALAHKAGAITMVYKEVLGHDIGRALGIREYPADINIVIDADFIVDAADLKPFIVAVASGVDIALNDLNPLYLQYASLDNISLIKLCLNVLLKQEHLGVNSLTAVPHALSKRAVEIISPDILAIPPKALAKGQLQSLSIRAVHTVDVFKPNRIRPELHSNDGKNHMEQLIIGDHVEAMAFLMEQVDTRGGFPDLFRRRDLMSRGGFFGKC